MNNDLLHETINYILDWQRKTDEQLKILLKLHDLNKKRVNDLIEKTDNIMNEIKGK